MIKNTYSGKFFVFEGLDGSGQSTQANLLKDFLIKKGFEVILTKEPTKTSEAGRRVRQILDEKTKSDPADLQKLFVQDRQEHLEKEIIPALKNGKFVISDRYCFSTICFGGSDGLDIDWLIKLNENFLLPDATFILKVAPRVCVERIEKRGTSRTLFEKELKLAKVWENYKTMPQRFENVFIIDGEKPIQEVHQQILSIIIKVL